MAVIETASALRIGDVAELVGTTPRTIRYYEEIGLLPEAAQRESGRHRVYAEADVERLRELLRLKELLGVSLDELKELVEAEEARAGLREEWERGGEGPRRKQIVAEALAIIERQLELVHGRREQIERLEADLKARRRRLRDRRRRLEAGEQP
jgi:DNA-binding transcriptional MerR regulator